jgi:hypothetical protein
MRAARQHQDQGDRHCFVVVSQARHHDAAHSLSQEVEERTTRQWIRADMSDVFRSLSYAACAAKYFGGPVLAPPPGVGALFAHPGTQHHPSLNIMFIDKASYPDIFAYLQEEFGPEFEPTNSAFDQGYVDYARIGARDAPLRPPFSSECYYLLRDVDNYQTVLRFQTRQRKILDRSDYRVRLTAFKSAEELARSPVGAAAGATQLITKGGHLYELYPKESHAAAKHFVFAQQDGAIFEQDQHGRFVPLA